MTDEKNPDRHVHLWERPLELDPRRFTLFAADVRALIAELNDGELFGTGPRAALAGQHGTGAPVITDEAVIFNGDNTGASRTGRGAFRVQRVMKPLPWQRPSGDPLAPTYTEECDTGRLPYDTLVVASLISLGHHFPEVKVMLHAHTPHYTPGVAASPGHALYEEVFGHARAA